MRQIMVDSSMSDDFLPEFLNKFWGTCYPMYVEKHPHLTNAVSSLVMSTIKIQKNITPRGLSCLALRAGNRRNRAKNGFYHSLLERC